jgi:dethiobiotin synthetase
LGTINHALLSIEAIRARKIPLHGIAFIGDANPESEKAISEIGKVKRLGRLPIIAPLTAGELAMAFLKAFNPADFNVVEGA